MNTLTKQQVDEVIEKLVDESLTFGCLVDVGWSRPHYVTVLRTLRSNTYSICNFRAAPKYNGLQDIIEYQDNFTVERTPLAEIKQVLGHPILIGDVLFLDERKASMAPSWGEELLKVWPAEWRKQSLQEIAGRIEWEDCKGWHKLEHPCDDKCRIVKPSPETDLLLFLYNLHLTK